MSQDSSPSPPDALRRPDRWLPRVVGALDQALAGATIEGVAGGNGWLSLRVDGRFLWCMTALGLRLAWLGERAISSRALDWLGRHRSPFTTHLTGRRIRGVRALANAEGQEEGLNVDLDGRHPILGVRFWPRPGAIWLCDEQHSVRAQTGRLEGETLRPLPLGPVDEAALDAHGEACEARLRARLGQEIERRLHRDLQRQSQRLRRRIEKLRQDLTEARSHLDLRQRADLLAAHLHELRPGMTEVVLEDFEGHEVEIPLDPRLRPHENVDRLYRRISRAERKAIAVTEQLETASEEEAGLTRQREDLEKAQVVGLDLESWIDLAEAHGLEPARGRGPERERRGEPRLPYWSYIVDGIWEVRVGRSARDNDELLRRHSDGHDLWLHAQGCAGSHVVVRTAKKEVPRRVIHSAARLAAHYSRDRNSATVAVLLCERRYVRKPRKAAPGEVLPERAETMFVEPGIPEDCERG